MGKKKCIVCGKPTFKPYYKFCYSCWLKRKESAKNTKIIKESSNEPKTTSKEAYIEKALKETDWDKMSYYQSVGKGKTKVDYSPGASFRNMQAFLGFIALGSICIFPILSIILFFVIIFIQSIVETKRRKYLSNKYDESHKQ